MSRGIISAAGVVGSLAFALPARAESRRHDGFYAAANAGLGYVTSSSGGERVNWKGLTTPASLWSGYTYGAVAFGGGISSEFAYTHAWLMSVDLFADVYPNPKGGFHIMPSAGWGFLFPAPEPPAGLVLGIGVGYDYWVGPEVSMGVMARMTFAPLYDRDDASYKVYAPALLYTVTYH